MNATLDESKVKEWLREFGKTYDTVGTTRSITTPGGKTVDVSGGTYGWSVDEAAELTALVDSIKKGEVVEKEPAYAQTAATHDAQDWGTTYLEVDIPAQHMWYVVNGAVQLETDVVTGLPTPERETPTGVYRTKGGYWLRVTWTGIGFHDATWNPSFGGSRYQTNGSHGCINMPLDQAASLYGMLSMGTPVIIHN